MNKTLPILTFALLAFFMTFKNSAASGGVCQAVDPSPENEKKFSVSLGKLGSEEENWENHPRWMSKLDQWVVYLENYRKDAQISADIKSEDKGKFKHYEEIFSKADNFFFKQLSVILHKQGGWKSDTKWFLLAGNTTKWNQRLEDFLKTLKEWGQNEQGKLRSFEWGISPDNKKTKNYHFNQEDKKRHQDYIQLLKSEISRYEGLLAKYKGLVKD